MVSNSPELLASGVARLGMGGLVDSAMLLARTAAAGASGGAAPAGAAAGAGPARAAMGEAGSGGARVAADAVPHVAPGANTVSG
jgi:hypothetical protein